VHALLAREIGKLVTTRLALILNGAQPIFSRECFQLCWVCISPANSLAFRSLDSAAELQVSGRVLLASASLQLPEASEDLPEDPHALASSFKSAETCPACLAEITFDNLRKAICANGHIWGK